jgi:hypothetical protein
MRLAKRSCAAVKPAGEACHNVATQVATFRDGQKASVCGSCGLQMKELAESHGAPITLEPLS